MLTLVPVGSQLTPAMANWPLAPATLASTSRGSSSPLAVMPVPVMVTVVPTGPLVGLIVRARAVTVKTDVTVVAPTVTAMVLAPGVEPCPIWNTVLAAAPPVMLGIAPVAVVFTAAPPGPAVALIAAAPEILTVMAVFAGQLLPVICGKEPARPDPGVRARLAVTVKVTLGLTKPAPSVIVMTLAPRAAPLGTVVAMLTPPEASEAPEAMTAPANLMSMLELAA